MLYGLADADQFVAAQLSVAVGRVATNWTVLDVQVLRQRREGPLAVIPLTRLPDAGWITLRLRVEHANGQVKESLMQLQRTPQLQAADAAPDSAGYLGFKRGALMAILLLIMVLLMPLPAIAQVFKLPVWMDADQWARQQQFEYWRLSGDEMSEMYLVTEAAARSQACAGDVECMPDRCQAIRGAVLPEPWLVAAPPPLAAALAGERSQCEMPEQLRWQGRAQADARCWRLVTGHHCRVVAQALEVQQPVSGPGAYPGISAGDAAAVK